ncbi:MAG: hypothetical protein JRC86_13835 [Deltaproteobacteria bacterium]|nr:hypothetical protein [Deltaproteobacteria bacterium]
MLQVKFTVVNPNQLPHMPDEDGLRQSDLAEAAKITLYATWLAAQNHGKWVLQCLGRWPTTCIGSGVGQKAVNTHRAVI